MGPGPGRMGPGWTRWDPDGTRWDPVVFEKALKPPSKPYPDCAGKGATLTSDPDRTYLQTSKLQVRVGPVLKLVQTCVPTQRLFACETS